MYTRERHTRTHAIKYSLIIIWQSKQLQLDLTVNFSASFSVTYKIIFTLLLTRIVFCAYLCVNKFGKRLEFFYFIQHIIT